GAERAAIEDAVTRAAMIDVLAAKAWDGSASRFTDQEYAAACILDRADCSADWRDRPAKQRYSVPIRDPGADRPNPDALPAAAAALSGARTPMAGVCEAALAKARHRLLAAYRDAGMEPPQSLTGKALAEAKSAAPLRVAVFEC